MATITITIKATITITKRDIMKMMNQTLNIIIAQEVEVEANITIITIKIDSKITIILIIANQEETIEVEGAMTTIAMVIGVEVVVETIIIEIATTKQRKPYQKK